MKIYRLRANLPTFYAGALASLGEDGSLYFLGYPDRQLNEKEKKRHWKPNVMMFHKRTLEEWKILNPENGWFEEVDQEIIRTVWPFEGCKYYYISDMGVEWDIWNETEADSIRESMGNCFMTKEEAERAWERLDTILILEALGVRISSYEVNNVKVKGESSALGRIIISYPKEYYDDINARLKKLLETQDEY